MEQATEEETVFKSQDAEVYRIPALIYDTDNKKLLAFAEKRRTADDASTEELVMKTGTVSRDEPTQEVKITWSEVSTVVKKADLQGYRPMNPCPIYDKTSKTLYLFFIRVEDNVSEYWQISWSCNKTRLCYMTTKDAGKSWSEMTDLTDGLAEIKKWSTFAVGPGHGLQTESGRLIVPVHAYYSCCSSCCFCYFSCFCCFCYFRCFNPEEVPQYALALYKDQSDTNWKCGKMLLNKSGECQMAEFVDEQHKSFIYCNARTKGGFREEAVSENNGEDFSNLIGDPKLVETAEGCQGSVVSFPAQSEGANGDSQNKWLLYTHPNDKFERKEIAVYLNESPQDRNAWSKPWIIYNGPSAYSDLAYIGDGWFACLMECGKKEYTEQIALKIFNYSDVKQGTGE
ncbi:hypothetical protein L3Q82_005409 [Scortum barcoo]|uniref:Uncharacterized protein n=1 Tax=Scortum barcoo TaxID=214431 RepID=A0ACB8VAR6_9TELE|nr:hypothetical protein L3Q82_005409 [Scortum barcoo]